MRGIRLTILLAACLLALALPASAQTSVNPVTAVFTASTDHSAVAIDGSPMVARYEMRIFLEAGTTPLFVTDLGKPTPVLNVVTVTNAVWFSGLTPNTKYVAKIVAIGTSGEGVSDPSNPFGNVPPPAKPTAVSVKK